ncbi:flagellar protein FliT [Halobacillus fulvus]|nr:flagellar protein FliT [Halobacillus fulvus]
MSVWQQFLNITTELDELVHSQTMKRSAILEQVDPLLEKRQELIVQLDQPAEGERALLDEVKKRDLKINQKLEFLFHDLKQDMRQSKKQTASKKQYTNPYQSVSTSDGMYLDYKK